MWRGKTLLDIDSLTQGDPEGQWTSWLQSDFPILYSNRLTGTSGKKYDYHFIIHISLLFGTSNEVSNCCFFFMFPSQQTSNPETKSWTDPTELFWLWTKLGSCCALSKSFCAWYRVSTKTACRTNCRQNTLPTCSYYWRKVGKRWVVISITTTCFIPLQSCFQLLHAIQLTWYQ